MNLSFLITTHNEGDELDRLLQQLCEYIEVNKTSDEIVILDDYSDNQKTIEILTKVTKLPFVKLFHHRLDKNFGEHKTAGSRACKNEYIFQLDADEYPHPTLLENVRSIIEANSAVELFRVPRVNIVRGMTLDDAAKWGWHVSQLPEFPGHSIVNWNSGDYQWRIYKNDERIKWAKKLHEIIVGAQVVTELPKEVELSIIHDKTIERQRAQNEFYNKNWSAAANMGQG